MATTLVPLGHEQIISSLDTYNMTAQTTATHVAAVTVNEIPSSGITITIKQNGTTVASTSAPAAAQTVISIKTPIAVTSGDLISFVLASSTPADANLNVFKAALEFYVSATGT